MVFRKLDFGTYLGLDGTPDAEKVKKGSCGLEGVRRLPRSLVRSNCVVCSFECFQAKLLNVSFSSYVVGDCGFSSMVGFVLDIC